MTQTSRSRFSYPHIENRSMMQIASRLFLFALIVGSSVGASEPYKAIVEVVAKLVYFSENAVWYDYTDGAESFHLSLFTALSPAEYCGKEVRIQFSRLPDAPEATQIVGKTYRIRIYSEQAKILIEGESPDTHTEFMYDSIDVVEVLGDDTPDDVECSIQEY